MNSERGHRPVGATSSHFRQTLALHISFGVESMTRQECGPQYTTTVCTIRIASTHHQKLFNINTLTSTSFIKAQQGLVV
jgi:hypothetical protein